MDNQSDDVMTAILDGKYSWACVLWLRGKGYNPKEYIPCRTYNRLLRQQQSTQKQAEKSSKNQRYSQKSPEHSSNIVDLPHLDNSDHDNHSVRGGFQAGYVGLRRHNNRFGTHLR